MRPLNTIRLRPWRDARLRVPAVRLPYAIAILTVAAFDTVSRKAVPRRGARPIENLRCESFADVMTGAISGSMTGGVAGVTGGVTGGAGGGWNSNAPMSGVAVPSPLPSTERGS